MIERRCAIPFGMKTSRLAVIVLMAAAVSGCADQERTGSVESPGGKQATPAALKSPTHSGFLKDYSNLKPSPTHSGALVERSAKLAGYTTFIIDTPLVLTKKTVGGVEIDEATAAQLAADLKAEAVDAMKISYTITEIPGPGVARVRSAITQLARCKREPGEPTVKIGGASVEMEIVDSVSGERLAAVVESDAVTSNDPQLKSNDPYNDAKLVFQHWSARFAKWMTDAARQ